MNRTIICPYCHGYDPNVDRAALPDGARYCTPLSCDAWTVTARLTKDGEKPIRPDGRADLREAPAVNRTQHGNLSPGPSEDYLKLLRGEISAAEYVRRLKRDVDARLKGKRR